MSLRVTCDAMCGGVARWLRAFGVDTTYTPDIADDALVAHALDDARWVITADGPLLDRRVFTKGALRAVRVPVGLKLRDQVRFVATALHLKPGPPRCMRCNGELRSVSRDEVADVVPARSLIWATDYFRCAACHHVYWNGTHWRRIAALRAEFE